MENENLLKNRFTELSKRSFDRGIWTFSEFLSLAEQDILLRLRLSSPYELVGGFEGAERRLAAFGSEDLCGYIEDAPIVCVQIAPVNDKFADDLTHRDFLGSLMALGIRREVLGDIAIKENRGYLFCLSSIADYICRNLESVRHTTVKCEICEVPEIITEKPPVRELIIASERLDAIVAAVYKLSRSESQALIKDGKVFINGRLTESSAADIPDGAAISVRGHGRFLYEGIERETKKGRLRVLVRIF